MSTFAILNLKIKIYFLTITFKKSYILDFHPLRFASYATAPLAPPLLWA